MQAVGDQVFVNPPRPENNIVKIPAAAGLGLTPNNDARRDSLIRE